MTRLLENAAYDKGKATNSVFGTLIPSIALYAKIIVHIVDLYLDEREAAAQQELAHVARDVSPEGDRRLFQAACEALRECDIKVVVQCRRSDGL